MYLWQFRVVRNNCLREFGMALSFWPRALLFIWATVSLTIVSLTSGIRLKPVHSSTGRAVSDFSYVTEKNITSGFLFSIECSGILRIKDKKAGTKKRGSFVPAFQRPSRDLFDTELISRDLLKFHEMISCWAAFQLPSENNQWPPFLYDEAMKHGAWKVNGYPRFGWADMLRFQRYKISVALFPKSVYPVKSYGCAREVGFLGGIL